MGSLREVFDDPADGLEQSRHYRARRFSSGALCPGTMASFRDRPLGSSTSMRPVSLAAVLLAGASLTAQAHPPTVAPE
jgi:hypothetical protein